MPASGRAVIPDPQARALYVSNLGFGGPAPGLGQILRITIPR